MRHNADQAEKAIRSAKRREGIARGLDPAPFDLACSLLIGPLNDAGFKPPAIKLPPPTPHPLSQGAHTYTVHPDTGDVWLVQVENLGQTA